MGFMRRLRLEKIGPAWEQNQLSEVGKFIVGLKQVFVTLARDTKVRSHIMKFNWRKTRVLECRVDRRRHQNPYKNR